MAATARLEARTGTAALLTLLCVLAQACSTCRPIAELDFARAPPPRYADHLPAAHQRIAVLGDTQRTSLGECLVGREVNDREQGLLLSDLSAQAPAALVLLGDMVYYGADAEHWSYFDHSMQGLRGTAVFPVLGNHEYYGSNRVALRELGRRFPRLAARTFYAFDWGSVRMLVLDANHDDLGVAGWRAQLRWLAQELARVNAGGARGAIVLLHQSPYTQSPWVSGDASVLADVVPEFCRHERTLALLSAHAHGYERYRRGPADGCGTHERAFVVTAGGGGPRPHERRRGAPRDASLLPWPRPFNYLLLAQTADAVEVGVRGLDGGGSRVRELVSERMTWPLTAKPASAAP